MIWMHWGGGYIPCSKCGRNIEFEYVDFAEGQVVEKSCEHCFEGTAKMRLHVPEDVTDDVPDSIPPLP